jgi:hypothetical protein
VDRDDVTLGEKLIQAGQGCDAHCADLVGAATWMVGEDVHEETVAADARHLGADGAQADEAQSLARELMRERALPELEKVGAAAASHPIPMGDRPIDSQEESEHVLSAARVRGLRDEHGNTACPGCVDGDVLVAGAGAGDATQLRGRSRR